MSPLLPWAPIEKKQQTIGMEPARTSSLSRSLHLRRALAALAFCGLGTLGYFVFVTPSLTCKESPRPRIEAIGIALHFAKDTFEGRSRSYRLGQLVETSETYYPQERAWRVLITSKDNFCQVEVEIRDCAWPRLGSGGECTEGSEGIIEIPLAPSQ